MDHLVRGRYHLLWYRTAQHRDFSPRGRGWILSRNLLPRRGRARGHRCSNLREWHVCDKCYKQRVPATGVRWLFRRVLGFCGWISRHHLNLHPDWDCGSQTHLGLGIFLRRTDVLHPLLLYVPRAANPGSVPRPRNYCGGVSGCLLTHFRGQVTYLR